jgi:mRNA-degrading endonuclease toxin of MazEF toxin-antitoxin module
MPEFSWNIYQANLDPVVGSEQEKARPVLVISKEAINRLLSVLTLSL